MLRIKTFATLFLLVISCSFATGQNKTYRLVASHHRLSTSDEAASLDSKFQYTYNNKGYVVKINNIVYEYDEQERLTGWHNAHPDVNTKGKYNYVDNTIESTHSDDPERVQLYKLDEKSRIALLSNGSFDTNYDYDDGDELQNHANALGGRLTYEYHKGAPLPNPWMNYNNALLAQTSFGFFEDSLYSINPFGVNHHSKIDYETPDSGKETITYKVVQQNEGGYPTIVEVTHTKTDSLGNTTNYTGQYTYQYEELDA